VRTDPTTNHGDKGRRRLWPAAPLVVLGCGITLAAAAVAVWPSAHPGEPPAGRRLSGGALAAESQPGPALTPTRRRQLVNLVDGDAAPPRHIRIPAIGVSAHVVSLHREPDGTMQTPRRWENAGWYEPGPEPGERGPAVIAGHIDSTAGPAVFYRLRELRRGNLISVRRADGSMLRFRVEGLERWPKSEFPTRRVFGRTTRISVLRLVTCAGNFDTSTGHYVDNTIVYAARVPGHRVVAAGTRRQRPRS
jgi:sortase (surface protein transpeptidase)